MRAVILALLMICCAFAGSGLVAGDAELPDAEAPSIASRLASIKYAAIESREALGACVIIHAYTPAQHERSVALVKKYRAERDAYNNDMRLLQNRLKEVQDQDPNDHEEWQQIQETIEAKRMRFPRLRPYYLKASKFYRVVAVGQDFIEVEEIDNPEGTMLVPLSKLAKVVFPRAEQTSE